MKNLFFYSFIFLFFSCKNEIKKHESKFNLISDFVDFEQKMENGDTLKLYVDLSMCMTFESDKVLLIKENDSLFIELKKNRSIVENEKYNYNKREYKNFIDSIDLKNLFKSRLKIKDSFTNIENDYPDLILVSSNSTDTLYSYSMGLGGKSRFYKAYFYAITEHFPEVSFLNSYQTLHDEEYKGIDSKFSINTNSLVTKARLFNDKVSKNNGRSHKLKISDSINNIKVLLNKNLDSILAFSDKNYPKYSNPRYYEHFNVFCFQYKSILDANNAIALLQNDIQYNVRDIDMKHFNARQKNLLFTAKSGGLFVQKDNIIFHLVKKCRGNSLKLSWSEYENLFLKFLFKNKQKVKVINADCGRMIYEIEQRIITH